MDEVANLKEIIQQGEEKERQLEAELRDLLAGIPNTPLPDVPVGDEKANKELRKVGTPIKFPFPAEAAFRDRRSARADGFRDRSETFR